MRNNYIIRKAQLKDLSEIIKLIRTTLAEEIKTSGLDLDRLFERIKYIFSIKILLKLLQFLYGFKIKILVAEWNKEIVGMTGIAGRDLFQLVVCINPKFRRKGLATRLIKSILEDSQRMRGEGVFLDAMIHNKSAINLYHKLGFKIVYYYYKYTKVISFAHTEKRDHFTDTIKVKNFRNQELNSLMEIGEKCFPEEFVNMKKFIKEIYTQNFLLRFLLFRMFNYRINRLSLFYRNNSIGFFIILLNLVRKVAIIGVPIIEPENLKFFPWGVEKCHKLFKNCIKIYIDVPVRNIKLIEVIESMGFNKESEWVRMVKWNI